MIMKRLAALFLSTFLFSFTAYTAVYEWTDDKGVLNFTDNPDSIPPKYLIKIKKRPSIIVEKAAEDPAEKLQEKQTAAPKADSEVQKTEKLVAGHDDSWWRSRFLAVRNELKAAQDGLAAKKDQLLVLRHQMTPQHISRSRKAMYDKRTEIEKDEARVKELSEKLNALDAEAAKEGVPGEWR